MSDDKKVMPASGNQASKGKPDGVSGTPGAGGFGQVHGRLEGGGESSGGSYPNPHAGKDPDDAGFPSHGGQTEIDYYGPDNPNATTGPARSDGDRQAGPLPSGPPSQTAHSVRVGSRTIEVFEDSGVAAAEASGKIATDAPYEQEQENPGGG